MQTSNGTTEVLPRLLGPDGHPVDLAALNGSPATGNGAVKRGFGTGSLADFVHGSFPHAYIDTEAPPVWRAKRPFVTHAWVYAAAMAVAVNLTQAPFTVCIEREEEEQRRRARMKRAGMPWRGAQSGRRRTAFARHLDRSGAARARLMRRALEPFPEHPLNAMFVRANPLMSGADLFAATAIWMCIRGEAGWLMISDSGDPLDFNEQPAEIWPLNPSAYEPIVEQNRLVGWWYKVQKGTGFETTTRRIRLGLNELIVFRYFNPYDPFRGQPPLQATSGAVEMDLLTERHNRSTIVNGANPGGVLVDKTRGGALPPQEQREFEQSFSQRHSGPEHNRRMMFLQSGMEWVRTGMTPQEMEFLEQRRWDREEILAALRVPKSVVSVTDDLNYSIQISQDKNFWDKCLLPLIKLFERQIDATLLFPQTDNIVACFDMSQIEALRLGMGDAIGMVKDLTGPEIHMPPRQAFEMVGLEDAPEYELGDQALVSPMLLPAGDLGLAPAPSPTGGPGPPAGGQQEETTAPSALDYLTSEVRQARDGRLWQAFQRAVWMPIERSFEPRWRRWVREMRQANLRLFDQTRTGGGHGRPSIRRQFEDVGDFMLDLTDMQRVLGESIRPVFQRALGLVFDWTVTQELDGIPVFGLDHPIFQAFFDRRERVLLGTAPKTLQGQLRRSLREGIEASETLNQLRERVSRVYRGAASHSKTLLVSRTETGGFVNGARNEMFNAAGFTEEIWSTALDEAVRDSHRTYGAAGAKPRGFNYLTIRPGGQLAGRLEYPNDDRAPVEEVANCRCLKRPAR